MEFGCNGQQKGKGLSSSWLRLHSAVPPLHHLLPARHLHRRPLRKPLRCHVPTHPTSTLPHPLHPSPSNLNWKPTQRLRSQHLSIIHSPDHFHASITPVPRFIFTLEMHLVASVGAVEVVYLSVFGFVARFRFVNGASLFLDSHLSVNIVTTSFGLQFANSFKYYS